MCHRQIVGIVMALCVLLWIATYLELVSFTDNVVLFIDKDKRSVLEIIFPFYSKITPYSILGPLEDAKFNEQTGKPLAYLRTFEEPYILTVPKSWCLPSNQTNLKITSWNRKILFPDHSESLLNAFMRSCFVDKDPNALDRLKLRHSLRLLRNAFEEGNVQIIIMYGSMLGSLRYHKRMFYDVDYDFLVHEQDMERAFGILAKLSANASTEMRLIDARISYGLPKFGFLCGSDPTWRQHEKRCIEKTAGYVVCNSVEATDTILRPCLFYADFYWMRKNNLGTINVCGEKNTLDPEDVINSDYRPLEGTLFRSVRNFDRYAKAMYGSPFSMCVPKTGQLDDSEELSMFIMQKHVSCKDFEIPCAYIDKHHPRTYGLTDGRNEIELGLHWLNSEECASSSIFVKFG
ncbi:unnamed protein product [Schistocephalus solidus]|uniref:Fukutin-related protein n=1 Tax=Schistocephalus solidus TaxID=70667 RepID=A0A183SZS3_SCHSO|nr:unnamed protein product [Schistocephalus solidus]